MAKFVFVHGWEFLTGGEGGANGKIVPRGPKTYSRGPPRAIFSPHGPNVPIYHLLPISRGPFFFARGPFMARGPLFEKHWPIVLNTTYTFKSNISQPGSFLGRDQLYNTIT